VDAVIAVETLNINKEPQPIENLDNNSSGRIKGCQFKEGEPRLFTNPTIVTPQSVFLDCRNKLNIAIY
jgi:hypothetical protein